MTRKNKSNREKVNDFLTAKSNGNERLIIVGVLVICCLSLIYKIYKSTTQEDKGPTIRESIEAISKPIDTNITSIPNTPDFSYDTYESNIEVKERIKEMQRAIKDPNITVEEIKAMEKELETLLK